MLQEHEIKQVGMFTKHEQLILDLISGHQALRKQRLDNYATVLLRGKQAMKERNLEKA